MLKNSDTRYGLVARTLHWLMALLLAALFALGWYMTEISYYDPWYKVSFDLHKSFGVVALVLGLARIGWALLDPGPPLAVSMKPWERLAAKAGHYALYALLVLVPVSGYLISTADGHPVRVFGLFDIPALLPPIDGMEDIAGLVHYFLGFGGAWLVVIHALAALKHQYLDRDGTLDKMIGRTR